MPQKFRTARGWYEAAAGQNHADAQKTLGDMYRYGEGIKQNDKKACQWYKKAAAQGHEEAQKALNALKG